MNAAIYARVSTDWQAEHGYSIDTQLETCRKKAAEIGATVIKEYIDEGYSGGFLERPGLDALRDAVAAGLYDVVIFHDPDRMARKLIHQLIITEEIEKAGAAPVFVMERFDDSPEGQMNYQMKGVFAEYERAKIRERTMRGKRAKLRAGKVICDAHLYGFSFNRENSCYEIDKPTAQIVYEIYEMYVVKRAGSCDTLADILNERGIPSPAGVKWRACTIRNILRRPHYTGKYYANTTYHKKTGPRSYKRIPRPREEWIEMSCPQIILAEWHEKALKIMAENRTYTVLSRGQRVYLLQGISYCLKCGARLCIYANSPRNKKNSQKALDLYERTFYECANTTPRTPGDCRTRMMKTQITDELFWNVLAEICKDEKTLTAYIESREKSPRLPLLVDKPAKLAARLKKIHAEKTAVMTWFSDALLTQSEATEKLKALKAEETKLQAELSEAERLAEGSPQRLSPADIVAAVASCPESLEARRRVILNIIDRVDAVRRDNNYGSKYIVDFEISFK